MCLACEIYGRFHGLARVDAGVGSGSDAVSITQDSLRGETDNAPQH